MLLQEFPDITWLKDKINRGFRDGIGWNGRQLDSAGWPTVLLHAKANKTVRDQIKGPLSIFTTIKGSEFVSTSHARARVTEDVFFISNCQQLYTLEITEPVETFNIHIGENLSEELLYERSHSASYLLDNPDGSVSQSPSFYNKLYWKDNYFRKLIAGLTNPSSKLCEQELLASMVEHLMMQTNQLKNDENSLGALKATTRTEIVKRLFIVCDYIYSHYQTDITLDELSRIGCFSKFHFLRLFKIFFQETPHQFITRLRIEKAKELLNGETGIKEIAARVGFADASSFSRSFKNKVGVYPQHFARRR